MLNRDDTQWFPSVRRKSVHQQSTAELKGDEQAENIIENAGEPDEQAQRISEQHEEQAVEKTMR